MSGERKLYLPPVEGDVRPWHKRVLSLQKTFRSNSARDIEKVIRLSVLLAAENYEASKRVLESLLTVMPYDPDSHLWADREEALGLLTFMAMQSGDGEALASIRPRIVARDYSAIDLVSILNEAVEDMHYVREEEAQYYLVADELTPKEIADGYISSVILGARHLGLLVTFFGETEPENTEFFRALIAEDMGKLAALKHKNGVFLRPSG